MSKEPVLKKFRDLAATIAVVLVLLGVLVLVNQRMRERVGEVTYQVQSRQWNHSGGPIGVAVQAVYAFTSDYAEDNPYLFVFFIVAGALFLLMLRVV